MKALYSILLLFSLSLNLFAQEPNWQWAKSAGGEDYEFGRSVTTDLLGNVYIAGSFKSPTIVFGSITLKNADISGGAEDIDIVKYDANGNVLWAKSAGGIWDDEGNSVATDAFGNVYLAGTFYSPILDIGTRKLNNVDSIGNTADIFVIKYDSIGNLLWAKSAGGKYDDKGISIIMDVSENLYLTGSYNSDTLIFGNNTFSNLYNQNFATDVYLVKYDKDGNVLWAKSAGGSDYDNGTSVTTDPSGDVYVTGSFRSPALKIDNISLINSGPYYNIFILKCDSMGNVIWAKSVGGIENISSSSSSIATDAFGNLFITGTFSFFAVFGIDTLTSAGWYNMFLVKYDPNGNVLWANSANGDGLDFGSSIVTDISGNVYLIGTFLSRTLVFGSTYLVNLGTTNIYLVKYDPSGKEIWAKSGGGYGYDYGNSITIDPFGNVFITGDFSSSMLYFGSNTLLNNAMTGEASDIYLAKLSTTVATNETQNENDITIYPNPFSSQTTIQFSKEQKNTFIKILDVVGKEIKSIHISGKQVILEKGEMNNGIYFLQIIDQKNHLVNKKIVIQ